MDGTPVRGHEWRNEGIKETSDISDFQSELVRTITSQLHHCEVVFGALDAESQTLQLPSWMKGHLDRHPALQKKLEQGDLVGISHTDETPGPRPAARLSVLLFPVMSSQALRGAIGLISSTDGPQLLQDEIEMVRQIAHQAGPIIERIQDITELRRQNIQLNGLLQMRSHMQSNIAHELRTPLAAVRGYARMILDGRAGQTNDTQKEYLRVVNDNTTRLINLVNWMSQMIEGSQQNFNLSRFDLRALWTERLKASRESLTANGIRITEQIPDEAFEIVGDSIRLASVFDHLIRTAISFATGASNIFVQFSRGRERDLTVKISDAGAIVPADLLIRIFDRSLTSVPMPLGQKTETGELGLSDVYDIIGMHGGRFFVNSKTGQGVTFLFTLPAVELDGEENVGHEQAVNSGRRRR